MSNILHLLILAAVGCSTGNYPQEREYVVAQISLDSLEQTRKDKPLPPIAIYSDYNILLLDSVKNALFFEITEWYDSPNDLIIDRDYLNQDNLKIKRIKDVMAFMDSLSSAHQVQHSAPTHQMRISILTDTDTIKREDFFIIHDFSKSNNINLTVRRLYDFERQYLDKNTIN